MKKHHQLLVLSLLFASAAANASLAQIPNPYTGCFASAANQARVSPLLLSAIGCIESRFNHKAVNNANANASSDYGVMQINSGELPRLAQKGIDVERLMDPCTNIHIGAEILAQKIKAYGNTWQGVGAYNAKSEHKRQNYAWKVFRVMKSGECRV